MAQRQFRSDDTSPWLYGWGDGSDGDYSSAGNATDAPVDSSCSGTAGETSLSATNASFANGKPVLIHQTRGTGAGAWELNKIQSYTAGTITLSHALMNTYTDSGASQAQVIQLKQYNNFTQNSGHTLTAKAWNQDVGGIVAFLAKGTVTITGSIVASTKGDRGGPAGLSGGNNSVQYRGEGTAGDIAEGNSSENAGSGGYNGSQGTNDAAGGAGGGHGTAGTNGERVAISGTPNPNTPLGGAVGGAAALTTAVFGGGGGEGGGAVWLGYVGGAGGAGGGLVLIIGKTVTITGSINNNGGGGGNGSGSAGGGGGAGGAVLIKTEVGTLGTNLITVAAGSGGAKSNPGAAGGAGGVGRIHIDYKTSYTGTTTPTIDATQDTSLVERGFTPRVMVFI